MSDIPLVKLRVQLLKPEVVDFDCALEHRAGERFALMDDFDFEGCLYIASPTESLPEWFKFVNTGIREPLAELQNRSNAAVLLIRRQNRIFAFTFGHGRYHIKKSAVVSDFGLRTALNGLEHDSLRSVDSFSLEDQTIHVQTQTSRASEIQAFGIDIDSDIVRSVTGLVKEPGMIHSLSGNETTLAVATRIHFKDLGRLCDRLLALYNSTEYRNHFPWVDNISRVRDPALIERLDNILVTDLAGPCTVKLAPPEPIDWIAVVGFEYTRRRKQLEVNLDIKHYLEKINSNELTPELLKKHQVFAMSDDRAKPKHRWSVYKCATFETVYEDKRYVLSNATWFEIDATFSDRIRRIISGLTVLDLGLPKIHLRTDGKLEHEPDYNKRVADELPTIALLDGQTVRCRRTSTGIEPCDLLTEDRHLIFVKHRRGGSSPLSHLFAQARISCEALMADEEFRQDVRRKLELLNPAWIERVPLNQPNPSDYHIVIAVLGIDNEELRSPTGLPFFSQVNLASTVQSIRSRGFNVAVVGIDLDNSSLGSAHPPEISA